MIVKYNVPVYDICWLNHAEGGIIGKYYEPESLEELKCLCKSLFEERIAFDIVGHTSNIYFMPNYNVDIMVSTRKVRNISITNNYIIADCGVSVKQLSKRMVDEGIIGFDGLVDLPGTVAASVYGNSSCYGCSINSLLVSIEVLTPSGDVLNYSPDDLKMTERSTALKRGELKGVILSVKLRKVLGDLDDIKKRAKKNHEHRLVSQPGPKDNLGSIYFSSSEMTIYSFIPRILSNLYGIMLKLFSRDDDIKRRKLNVMLYILGAKELIPYVYGWNRYLWKDEKSHALFWEFHKLHKRLFKESNFEIEIRGKK